jgi:hypothetical protein
MIFAPAAIAIRNTESALNTRAMPIEGKIFGIQPVEKLKKSVMDFFSVHHAKYGASSASQIHPLRDRFTCGPSVDV